MDEMIIQVQYGHILADYAGSRSVKTQVATGSSLRQVLQNLGQAQLKGWAQAFPPNREIWDCLRVFRNGEQVSRDQLDQILLSGDTLLLLPAIAGGKFHHLLF